MFPTSVCSLRDHLVLKEICLSSFAIHLRAAGVWKAAGKSSSHVSLSPLQKWQCTEDASGKLRIHKCKVSSDMLAIRKRTRSIHSRGYSGKDKDCNCGDTDFRNSRTQRKNQRQFLRNPSAQSKCSDLLYAGLKNRGKGSQCWFYPQHTMNTM